MLRFEIEVPGRQLDELRRRIESAHWPRVLDGSSWECGTSDSYLREMCEYWRTQFDWRSIERSLNAWPQFTTQIDGQSIHFIHARSPEPDALPIVITHGWPGCVLEFVDVLHALTDPRSCGGDPRDAFHVVCPSIPGFGWSTPLNGRGWNVARIADATVELMTRLGYDRFGAQGGDWGAMISAQMAARWPARLTGLHLNMVTVRPPPEGQLTEGLTPREVAGIERRRAIEREEFGYVAIQSTKPQTLSYGLSDSPVGLAAWILEKFRTWSDCDGDPEQLFGRDRLLGIVTSYWLTGTIGSSMQLYYETIQSALAGPPATFVDVPTGCALFPRELSCPPRRWAEQHYNVVRWTDMPSGGHFAALEQPQLFVDDVRAFFSAHRV